MYVCIYVYGSAVPAEMPFMNSVYVAVDSYMYRCMYVYVCMYVYMYVYTYMCVCMYVCMYVYMYPHICEGTQKCLKHVVYICTPKLSLRTHISQKEPSRRGNNCRFPAKSEYVIIWRELYGHRGFLHIHRSTLFWREVLKITAHACIHSYM